MTREELNILIAATEILHALKRQLRENREELCYLTESRLQNATAELHEIIRIATDKNNLNKRYEES